MLSQKIKYTDYNGVEREETFYFNLNKVELAEMELTEKGGLSNKIQEIAKKQDVSEMMGVLKSIILKAYGKKSEDGKRFVKSDEISKEFSQTEAYSELFMKLATDSNEAAAFINGIIPVDTRKQISEIKK